MSIKLTKRQTTIIDFIADFIAEKGFSPTYREIMTGVGLSSVSSVAEHVENLVNKGALIKNGDSARSLEVVDMSFPEATMLFQLGIKNAESVEDKEILEKAAEILGLEL